MGRHTSKYIAPSWSWASLDFTQCGDTIFRESFPYDVNYYVSFDRVQEEASVERMHLVNVNNDQFGQVLSGYLIMRGQWRDFDHWKDVPQPFFNGMHYGDWQDQRNLHLPERIKAGIHGEVETALPGQIVCSLDCIPGSKGVGPDLSSRGIIFMKIGRLFDVHVTSSTYNGVSYALMLEPIDGDSEEFRRIGIAQIPDDFGMTEGWPTRRVKIS